MNKPSKKNSPKLVELLTRERWIEIGRIVLTGVVALLYWQGLVPLPVLLVAVAIGLYPLVKKGLLDLFKERKVGTEIFVTIAKRRRLKTATRNARGATCSARASTA